MDRVRLTITLKKDLIRLVDKVVDGIRIRNRSHAIEYLLSTAVTPKVTKVFILAGGYGLKMRPFTYEMPKPMIPVSGRPILEHIIENLREQGFRDLIILVGHLGEKIKEHFGNGSKFGVHIDYVEEEKPSGTAGPLRLAKDLLRNGPFIMYYGDVLAKLDLRELIDYHLAHKGLATLSLSSVEDPSSYGSVRLRGTKIVGFEEKPRKSLLTSRLINAGIHVLNPKIIDYIPQNKFSMLEKDVFPKLVKEGRIYGYPFEGPWFDISTPEVYARALKEWSEK